MVRMTLALMSVCCMGLTLNDSVEVDSSYWVERSWNWISPELRLAVLSSKFDIGASRIPLLILTSNVTLNTSSCPSKLVFMGLSSTLAKHLELIRMSSLEHSVHSSGGFLRHLEHLLCAEHG